MTLKKQIEFLSAEAKDLDRAELLVACYELVLDFLNPIRAVVEKAVSHRGLGRVMSLLGAELPWNSLDPWSVPDSFWEVLRHLQTEHSPEVLTRGALGALDASLQMAGLRHIPSRQVEESFFHRRSFWVVPQDTEGCPPWSAGAEPEPSRMAGKEAEEVVAGIPKVALTGLSPLGWMSFVRILPCQRNGVSFQLAELDYELNQRLPSGTARDGSTSLKIGVSPVSRSMQPGCSTRGAVAQNNKSFSVYAFEEQEDDLDRWSELLRERILPACAANDVSILILPELTISPGLRKRLAEALRQRERIRALGNPGLPPRPVLVVAGSYHEPDAQGRIVNRSVVLDYRGLPVGLASSLEESLPWSHDKVARFLFETSHLFAEMESLEAGSPLRASLEAFSRGMGLDREGITGGTEPEELGQSFTVVSSRIGQVSVAICIDYLTHCRNWHDEIQGAWIDWIWVPAATTRVEDFRQIARELAIQGAGTVAVNACWLCEAFHVLKDQWAGLAHLPGNLGGWLGGGSRTVPHPSLCPSGCSGRGEGCLFVFSLSPP